MSRSVAATRKYCCFRRSSFPEYDSSFGYSTDVMFSLRCRASSAPW